MWQRGGSVPNEVTYPARSLNPMRARSLGRRRHRTASPFPCGVGEEKRREGPGLFFPKPGSHSAFLFERDRGSWVVGRASGAHAGTSERAGHLTSLGTKPPLCFTRTLRHPPNQLRQDVFASGGGPKSC